MAVTVNGVPLEFKQSERLIDLINNPSAGNSARNAFSRSVHHLGAYPHAAPDGLRADPATRLRRACLHLPCSKAAAFGLLSCCQLLPSWHTLARDRPPTVELGAAKLSMCRFRTALGMIGCRRPPTQAPRWRQRKSGHRPTLCRAITRSVAPSRPLITGL